MKKILVLIFIGILLGSVVAFAAVKRFSDVPSNASYLDAATSLVDKGIMTGYPNGKFRPAKSVNRAELAVTLDRMLKYMGASKTACVNNVKSYSNTEPHLAFNYPCDWFIDEETTANIGDHVQLHLVLHPVSNEGVDLSIYTPLLETGYENSTSEPGFERAIAGLTLESARLLRNDDSAGLIALNTYYKVAGDFFSSLEFLYSAGNGGDFDGFLPAYYAVLDSVVFD